MDLEYTDFPVCPHCGAEEAGEVALIEIEVPGIPPSLNKMRNMHHYQWNRTKQEWASLITFIAQRKRPSKPFEKAVVTLTYHFRDKRRRDPDNYSGKFLLDPLVEMGFLVDDSFDHVELRHRKGGVDRKNPRTVIRIEEVAKDDVQQDSRGTVLGAG